MLDVQTLPSHLVNLPSAQAFDGAMHDDALICNCSKLSKCLSLSKGLTFKGHSQFWDHAHLNTSFLTSDEKSSPQPEIKVHPEIRSNFCSVLLDFQLLTENPVFECPFVHPIVLLLS